MTFVCFLQTKTRERNFQLVTGSPCLSFPSLFLSFFPLPIPPSLPVNPINGGSLFYAASDSTASYLITPASNIQLNNQRRNIYIFYSATCQRRTLTSQPRLTGQSSYIYLHFLRHGCHCLVWQGEVCRKTAELRACLPGPLQLIWGFLPSSLTVALPSFLLPQPPRSHFSNIEANESEEVRQFRRLFTQLAGDDMEVSATELMNIMNKVVTRHPDLKTDGFGIDTCRSMVAVMDSDTTGKLGFEEFKYLWNNIKKWQCIYKQYDADRSGTIGSRELPGAFEAAGFHLNQQLYAMIVRRYSDESGNMDFDNFISCLVRLDAMFRKWLGQRLKTIHQWSYLPPEVVSALSPAVFKKRLDTHLCEVV
uniref:Calpain small subunit 1 n=1 Tax=Naja naja TaxID=35670 RepID=A0A8C6YAY0_NAJNA